MTWGQPPPGIPFLGWHPLDPPAPHRAAPLLGRLVASGLMERDWALDALLHAAERLRRPGASASGLQTRLVHRLDDAIRAHEVRRAWAEREVRRAVAPEVLRRCPRAALLRLADAADPDGALLARERAALVRAEVVWAMRTGMLPVGTGLLPPQAVHGR